MKKLIILSAFSFLIVAAAGAQEIFQKGTSVANIGIGLGHYVPIQASYEYSVVDGLIEGENGAIGVGGYLAYYGHSENLYGGKFSYSDVVIGARGSFHYQFVDKLDTYAGLMLGYDIASAKWSGSGAETAADGSGLSLSILAGARYYFTPSVAAYGEIGYGLAYLSVGVALKF
ncbi:MAG: hypothetical protein LBJ58_02820 [Tannerellaceae bacterium]|jgi:hypothetical protein|nr:hypothetical protein [Tannerellaceae bacterium]